MGEVPGNGEEIRMSGTNPPYGGSGQLPAMPDDDGTPQRPLRELDFMDVIISERGDAKLRGLEGAEGPLVDAPACVLDDLDRLHRLVCDKGQTQAEFFMDFDGMRFRVARTPDVEGTWYILRRAIWPIPRMGQLTGLSPLVIRCLGNLGQPGRHGLVIIAGAAANGKTTTACSLLQEYLLHYGDIAVALEDPPELPLSGKHGQFGQCFQINVENSNFEEAMERTMRRSPRYILLGEVRSPGAASQALRAAINGHLVITTIHAGSVVEAINAMLKFVSGREPMSLAQGILADGLAGVVHQQLVRSRGRSGGRMLKIESLFPGNDKGIRSLIRGGKTEQLSTNISQQATRVSQGRLPIEE